MEQSTNGGQDADAWEQKAREELTKFDREPEPVHEPEEPRCETWDEALIGAAERAGIELSHSE